MVTLQQVKYCMDETYQWQDGWLIGDCDGHTKNSTLLDGNFQPVPKIIEFDETEKREFTCYDMKYRTGVYIDL